MKKWSYLILKCLATVVTFVAIFIFPAKDFETDLAKATLGLGVIMILEVFENKKPKPKPKERIWYVRQDGEDFFLTCDCPREGKVYEGDMFRCQGFIDGYKKILNIEMRVCRTCKNPYCSRTLEERQKVEVQMHTQYGWECCDKEKYLQNDGGYVLVRKRSFEKAVKSFTPKNEVVDAIAYAIYYTANPDSEMCVPNCAYIQAEKMFKKWKKEK